MGRMLVTGGARFVGRHLTKALLEAGHEVHAVDSLRPLTGALDPAVGWPLFEPRDYHDFVFHRADCRDRFRSAAGEAFDAAVFQWAAAAYPVRREGYTLLSEEMIALGDEIGLPDMSHGWAKLTAEYLARGAGRAGGARPGASGGAGGHRRRRPGGGGTDPRPARPAGADAGRCRGAARRAGGGLTTGELSGPKV